MPLLERGKKIVENITGWERPSSGELDRQVRSRKANAFFFRDDGIIPNHPAGFLRHCSTVSVISEAGLGTGRTEDS
jgi:hypothetical protein